MTTVAIDPRTQVKQRINATVFANPRCSVSPFAEARAEARKERERAAGANAAATKSTSEQTKTTRKAVAADSPQPPTPSQAAKAYLPEAPSAEDFAEYNARKEEQIAELEMKLAHITSEISGLRDASEKGTGKRRRRSGGGGGSASGSAAAADATESSSGSEAGSSPVGDGGYVSPTTALAGDSAGTRRQRAAAAAGGSSATPTADTPPATFALEAMAAGSGLVRTNRPPFTVPGISFGDDDGVFGDDDGSAAASTVAGTTDNDNNSATAAAAAELLAQLCSSRSDAERLATLERRLRAADAELAAARKRSKDNAQQR